MAGDFTEKAYIIYMLTLYFCIWNETP